MRGNKVLRQVHRAAATALPFRLRDALTGKWYRTRWVAELHEIERMGGIVDGEPEIRERIYVKLSA